MTIDAPRCPALHPDLPYARCARREGHGAPHRTFTDLEWENTMHPDGRLTWNHRDDTACSYCAHPGKDCRALSVEEWRCTRAPGHKGAHVACDDDEHHVYAWEAQESLDPVTDPSVGPSVSREWTADDFANARFARHPQSGRIAARLRPEKMWAWTAGRDEERLRDDQMMAGWVPVQETQPDEQPSFSDFLGRLSVAGSEAEEARKDAQFWQARWKEAVDRADARDDAAYRWKEATREHVRRIRTVKSYVEALQGGIDQEKARAEKAEQERDEGAHIGPEGEVDWHGLYLSENRRAEKAERAAQTLGKVIEDQCRDIARITRSEHLVDADGDADWGAIWERGHDMDQRLHDAEARIDELRDQVGLAIREKDEWEANATQPRGFTAEDITYEMVERALTARDYNGQPYFTSDTEAHDLLTAALTEPPARPEGAEEIEALIDRAGTEGERADSESLADYLAGRGVRVTGAES